MSSDDAKAADEPPGESTAPPPGEQPAEPVAPPSDEKKDDGGTAAGKKQISAVQMKAAQKRMHAKKAAVAKAKEEEKNYVEFRKQEILFAYRPKTAGALRPADEQFPRRRRGISMGFGERKAYFLSLRPNPQFATWFGKKNNLKTKAKTKTMDQPNRIMAPCAPTPIHKTAPSNQRKVSKSNLVKDKKDSKEKEDSEDSEQEKKNENVPKGINASKPLVRGVPFWTVGTEGEDEITDDDLPIDMEIIDKVCNGEKLLAEKPFEKLKFDPWDNIDNMKHYDKLFDRETILFSNTVETVLNLYPEKQTKPVDRPELPKKVKWSKQITVTYFDKANRDPSAERKPETEPMRDIKREKL